MHYTYPRDIMIEPPVQQVSAPRLCALICREAPRATFKLADLFGPPVPRFKILSSLANSLPRRGHVSVKIAIDATLDPVKAIRVEVNGR